MQVKTLASKMAAKGSHRRVRFHLHGNAVSAQALSAFSRAKKMDSI
jgi:hypothetical protein